MNEEKLKAAFTDDDKKTIEDAANEGLQWLEANQDADTDSYAGKQKEIEAKFNPIMQRVYQAAGGAPGAGGMPGFPGAGAGEAPTAAPDGGAGVDDLD